MKKWMFLIVCLTGIFSAAYASAGDTHSACEATEGVSAGAPYHFILQLEATGGDDYLLRLGGDASFQGDIYVRVDSYVYVLQLFETIYIPQGATASIERVVSGGRDIEYTWEYRWL